MRKVLGLLVAAVFVVTAASASFAASSSTYFKAEISFASTSTAFGFTLWTMAGSKPAGGDTSATMINWANPFKQLMPGGSDGLSYGPGMPQTWYSNSRVYAKIDVKELAPGTTVKFYTNNTVGTANYKFHTSLVSTNAMPLAAMKSTNAVNAKGLPLTYKIVDSSMTSIGLSTNPTDTATWAAFNVANLEMADGPYGVFFVLDDKNPSYATDGVTAGEYAVIATDQGLRVGYGDNDAIHYRFSPWGTSYMFFATSAFDAFIAHRYGTEKLTVEVITE